MTIVTHDGQFHADEIFAIALIFEVIGECDIIRTREITKEMLQDPETWVIDVGGKFDEETHNFDHHQDGGLESSNVLVLNYLAKKKIVGVSLFMRLSGPFREISLIDRNGYEETNGFQVNSLIKSFNALKDGFELALKVAQSFIRAQIINELVAQESKELYEAGEWITPIAKICKQYPVFWKSYEDALIMVAPNQAGKWCVHSRDTKIIKLEPTGKEEFIHVARFIAVYRSKASAIKSAKSQKLELV